MFVLLQVVPAWCDQDTHSSRFGSGHIHSRSKVGISGTISPASKVPGEGKQSEEVKVPLIV